MASFTNKQVTAFQIDGPKKKKKSAPLTLIKLRWYRNRFLFGPALLTRGGPHTNCITVDVCGVNLGQNVYLYTPP
jgi:hypothetical protein